MDPYEFCELNCDYDSNEIPTLKAAALAGNISPAQLHAFLHATTHDPTVEDSIYEIAAHHFKTFTSDLTLVLSSLNMLRELIEPQIFRTANPVVGSTIHATESSIERSIQIWPLISSVMLSHLATFDLTGESNSDAYISATEQFMSMANKLSVLPPVAELMVKTPTFLKTVVRLVLYTLSHYDLGIARCMNVATEVTRNQSAELLMAADCDDLPQDDIQSCVEQLRDAVELPDPLKHEVAMALTLSSLLMRVSPSAAAKFAPSVPWFCHVLHRLTTECEVDAYSISMVQTVLQILELCFRQGYIYVHQALKTGFFHSLVRSQPYMRFATQDPNIVAMLWFIQSVTMYRPVLKEAMLACKWYRRQSRDVKFPPGSELGDAMDSLVEVVTRRWAVSREVKQGIAEATKQAKASNLDCQSGNCPRIHTGFMKRCSGCEWAFYCSYECQKYSWNTGHRQHCAAMQHGEQPSKLSYHNLSFANCVVENEARLNLLHIREIVEQYKANPDNEARYVVCMIYTEFPKVVNFTVEPASVYQAMLPDRFKLLEKYVWGFPERPTRLRLLFMVVFPHMRESHKYLELFEPFGYSI